MDLEHTPSPTINSIHSTHLKKLHKEQPHQQKHLSETARNRKRDTTLAPLLSPGGFNPKGIDGLVPDRYVVVFKEGVTEPEIQFHRDRIIQAQLKSIAKLNNDDPFVVKHKSRVESARKNESWDLGPFDMDDSYSAYGGIFTDDIVHLIRLDPRVEYVARKSVVGLS